jgi:PAS domain S-box-containing protein
MTELLRVLLVEDSEDDAMLLLRELKRGGYELLPHRVETAADMKAALEEGNWDIIIADYSMPQFSGLGALELSQTQKLDLPFILVSGTVSEEETVAAMKAGAHDYLIKGNLKRLVPAIQRELREANIRRERRQAEIERRAAEARLTSILDTAADAIIGVDGKERIVFFNQGAEKSFGYDASEIIGRPLDLLVSKRFIEIHRRHSTTADTTTGVAWRINEYEGASGKRQDGTVFPAEASISTFTQDDKEFFTIILRDVTEERKMQEHLQTQDRLATVGQLAAGIAHDFNNVMAVITLYSSTLARYPDHPKRENYLETINSQAQHAANLIGQILDFSRASVMELSRLDLVPFIKEMIKLLRRTLPENIIINLAVADEEYPVKADPTRLQQVLMNLAVNARDAMPNGGELNMTLTQLTLKPQQQSPLPGIGAGTWACLAVVDTGSGIPDDALPHIFEPFFTTKQPGQGTGLGLAQVYGIIKQHGGEIGVTSQRDRGTNFTFYLPLLDRQVQAGEDTLDQMISPAGGRETILLVEDDELTREAIRDTLDTLGYRVLATGSGHEAIALFEEHEETIDLVLSDMVMPEMSGVEFYQALEARHPGVKVMVATGYPLADEGKNLLERGVIAWIQKPFSASKLALKIREVLGN